MPVHTHASPETSPNPSLSQPLRLCKSKASSTTTAFLSTVSLLRTKIVASALFGIVFQSGSNVDALQQLSQLVNGPMGMANSRQTWVARFFTSRETKHPKTQGLGKLNENCCLCHVLKTARARPQNGIGQRLVKAKGPLFTKKADPNFRSASTKPLLVSVSQHLSVGSYHVQAWMH